MKDYLFRSQNRFILAVSLILMFFIFLVFDYPIMAKDTVSKEDPTTPVLPKEFLNIRNPFLSYLPKKEQVQDQKPTMNQPSHNTRQNRVNPEQRPVTQRPVPQQQIDRVISNNSSSNAATNLSASTQEDAIVPLPIMNIKGIVWGSDRPQAIINDSVYGIGETIGSVVIVDIRQDEIEVEWNGITEVVSP